MEYYFNIMQQLTSFSTGQFPVRYLGTPLTHGISKATHFSHLIEKIATFINSWSDHAISYAGKLEPIKVVVQGVEPFWIQYFSIHVTMIDRINKVCRRFL